MSIQYYIDILEGNAVANSISTSMSWCTFDADVQGSQMMNHVIPDCSYSAAMMFWVTQLNI